MAKDAGEAWREISPWLDDALSREPADREAWLRQLETSSPEIAAKLRELLAEHEQLSAESFLSDSPGTSLQSGSSLVGQQLGGYTIISSLGSGGMGSVWLARRSDGRFEGTAAIKLLNAALLGKPAEKRFVREGNLLARLDHPNIAHLLDAGIAPGGQPYLVLEHIEGSRIDKDCEQRELNIEERVRLFLDVLAAVEHAHSHLIVHRDLKPSNILVTQQGAVKLLDFGVAALLAARDENAQDLTREGVAGLTPEYAAPEQLLGLPVTTATDVYALGLVLFVLLAGRHPSPAGQSAAELMRLTLETETPPASHMVRDVQRERLLRGDLDNILSKALKKDPTERYPGAGAFAQDLRRFLAQEPVSARPDTLTYRTGKFVRRHRGGLATGLVIFIALLTTASFALTQMFAARTQRDEAVAQSKIAEGYSSVISSLLSQVGPGGRALHPNELLDRAVVEVQKRYADDAPAQVKMLIRISGRYYDLRDTNKEYELLLKAEDIARRHGDPELLLDVQCNTVETDLDAGRRSTALTRLAETRQLLTKVTPSSGLFADCMRAESQFARAEGDMPTAIDFLERARQALEDDGRTWGNRYSGVLSGLAACNVEHGDLVKAHRHLLDLRALDLRYGRIEGMGGLLSLSTIASNHHAMGQVLESRQLFEQILQGWNELPDSPDLNTSIAHRYADVLSRSGRDEEAFALLLPAVANAKAGGNLPVQAATLIVYARALLRTRQLEAADHAVNDALALLEKAASPHSIATLEALRVRADIRLAQDELAESEAIVTEALLRMDSHKMKLPATRARLFETRARVELAQGNTAAAIEQSDAAADLFRDVTIAPDASADVGESLLIHAQASLKSRAVDDARTFAQQAHDILQKSLGPDHLLVQDAGRLAQLSGDN